MISYAKYIWKERESCGHVHVVDMASFGMDKDGTLGLNLLLMRSKKRHAELHAFYRFAKCLLPALVGRKLKLLGWSYA